MTNYDYKIKNIIRPIIRNIKNIKILELGVERGRSTKLFLKVCNRNKGKLVSVDVNDCSKISKSSNWEFIQSRDDNFKLIKKKIKQKLDLIYLDTLHEADHVEKIFYGYYDKIKIGGYFIIDDISHLPYLKNQKRSNFYCEINNLETLNRVIEIYNNNINSFDLSISFISSGLAIIKKKSNSKLKEKQKILTRQYSLKNRIRNFKKFFV